MPKRKRDISLDELFARHRTDLFQALRTAKGFERQRQSKRLADRKAPPDKRARIENEIVVLKSLDLQQTEHAHLCSSLLRVKGIADAADRLPAEVRAGEAGWWRRRWRRFVRVLGVAVPEKKGRVRKGKEGDGLGDGAGKKKGDRAEVKAGGDDEEKDGGKEARPGKKEGKKGGEKADQDGQPNNSEPDEEEEEKSISQLDKLLGRARKRSTVELDPMEITTDEEDGDDQDLDPMELTSGEEEASGSEEEFNGFSDDEGQQSSASDDEADSDAESSASSVSRSPPVKKAKKAKGPLKPTDSTFLPSLMGGYISGSESASDIDVAPERRNRRGQRARQAIWEKKFGEKAKHLQEPAKGRDSGWDLKRGAVDANSKPWKRGIRNPLLNKAKASSGANDTELGPPKKEPAPRKRDDSGSLHPSWEARRLAKAKEQMSAPFQGKKITFD
ncbi:ribosome biogenesis protein [Chaetomium globosum CBS 148.51]|uniref:ribosome biogenesis protein n=1 Tax=Chaetomium globosum (strain ATCC 6205 / CBS 148.51 / DSM 1962 / NBRC 6347 / NRRL 1970) TaxID=306901 RepID=UPI001CCB30AC|nr:ribosome biogenesis protein [Chaetomium globosum CBS 148.51]